MYNQISEKDFQRVFCDADHEYKKRIGQIKRMLELWTCSKEVREETSKRYAYLPDYFGYDIDSDVIRILLDSNYSKEYYEEKKTLPSDVIKYKLFIKEKLDHRAQLRDQLCAPLNEKFQRWRKRQINRCNIELGAKKNDAIIHTPLNFELSKGCSVQCWFCALSAEKLQGVFLYTEENAQLWKDVLNVTKKVIGEGRTTGTCYHATEPLDNPDYEKFITDYIDILQMYPQTTTAIAYKHPERIRNILQMSQQRGGFVERFSILNLSILNKIFEEFTPEELVCVELLPQNNESNHFLAKAGKAALHSNKEKVISYSSTIECISGFLINMVDKSIKFVTPCAATEKNPSGFHLIAKEEFTDAADLEQKMNFIIDTHAKQFIEYTDIVKFNPILEYIPNEDGFGLKSATTLINFKQLPKIKEIGNLIHQGNLTALEIAEKISETFGESYENSFYTISQLFAYGAIDEF